MQPCDEIPDKTDKQIKAEATRINDQVELVMGGNDIDMLVDCLSESEQAREYLADLCAINFAETAMKTKMGDLVHIINTAQKLAEAIEPEARAVIAKGNYP